MVFVVIVTLCNVAKGQLPTRQSVQFKLLKCSNDSQRVEILIDAVKRLWADKSENSIEDAILFATKSANISEKNKFKKASIVSYTWLSKLYKQKGELKEAAKYSAKAVSLNLQLSSEKDNQIDELEEEIYQKEKLIAEKEKILKDREDELKRKIQEVDSLSQDNQLKQRELSEKDKELYAKDTALYLQMLESKRREAELQLVNKDKELNELKLIKKQNENKYYLIISLLAVFLSGILIVLLLHSKRNSKKLSIQNKEIAEARNRSEELLLNILPQDVADELKTEGKATAKHYDKVTVLFSDFKDFTLITEKLDPNQLVAEIDFCFRKFDEITTKHNLEKIKTIGDAYLCAGGLPVPNESNPVDVINAAIELQTFMNNLKIERDAKGEFSFEVRIGIHTGPVVAGIVGVKKFAYDIWGDTVNTAARMEQNSEPGKINISGTTYQLIKDKFSCTYRGKVEAKNKGFIDMYFVD